MEIHDITNPEDIRHLVDSFYAKAMVDELIGPIFTDVAKIDLEAHLPRLYAFWEMLVLGIPGYSGQPYPAHIPLGLKKEHFDRWLKLFTETLEENFKGMNAELTLQKTKNIAALFLHKLGEE